MNTAMSNVRWLQRKPSQSSSHTGQSTTPYSHFSLKKLKRENRRLKAELRQAKDKVVRKRDEINSLESQLTNMKRDEKCEYAEGDADADYLDSGELLSHHFSQVIRRHHDVLEQKNRKILELEDALARCQAEARGEEVLWSHDFRSQPSIAKERLRRTEAAVRVFRSDLDSVRNRLRHSSLEADRWPACSSRDRVILRELQRRGHFGTVTDLERMGQNFLERLELEERLDKLHWQIETKRFQVLQERTGKDVEPNCSYAKEFEMLEITRHNLLKALSDLRAQVYDVEPREPDQHVQFKNDVTINTIQNTYDRSGAGFSVASSEIRRQTSDYELPDK